MIYLVEDEKEIRELVLYTLNNSGLPAKGFEDGRGFWQAMAKEEPDLALLDIMLPGEDGLAILRRLRSSPKTAGLPVIMLTAKGSEYDKVLGLENGADDYLAKPFGMMELAARTKALLRRARPEKGLKSLALGDICVNIPGHRVSVGGKEISLTLKEFDLLVCLMENKGAVFSREQLLRRVWGFDYIGETRTVDTHILTLRGKLLSAGELIKTVRGLGYKIGEGGSE
ncbi:MAG: response regulator transcription factor [Spirochaetaceae bacterium]|nr:response regulator transcription factor [Spirochaetaceae bacterium]